ncbi:MAG: hypothetical protein D6712_12605 [Chloroflexi bacterium]|nr:MAG: hypothetical protein D6712_12605 [Chloroflexota bacterium]
MLNLKYRYCKVHMTAYINGELSQAARRRIARYIAEDPACRAEYMRQLDIARELEHRMQCVGRPAVPQLERIWAQVQTNIQTTPAPRTQPRRVRYGLMLLVVLLVLVLPWTLANRNVAPNIPSQPAPEVSLRRGTPEPPHTHTYVNVAFYTMSSTPEHAASISLALQNTPAPWIVSSAR